MQRCFRCNLKNPIYIDYHDHERWVPKFDDQYLFEMLILESFQAWLSRECILNKRENFRKAYDNFDIEKVCDYDENKIDELLKNQGIIRNKLKIHSSMNNAKIFKKIVDEFGSFYGYLKSFTDWKLVYEVWKTTNEWSDNISKDLQRRWMKFVWSTIIYSYLQAIWIINSHELNCFLHKN